MRTAVSALFLLLTLGCRTVQPDSLWQALQPLCGKAFEGTMVEGTLPADAEIGAQRLVMHVRDCGPAEIRIPFHVGEDRSRTWVITRTAGGLSLDHDHRHEDGTPDPITHYGGDSAGRGGGLSVDFPAGAKTAAMLPAAATNIWTVAVDPGRSFTYALRREGRRFRVEFDLTRPVEPPPPAW